MADRVTAEFVSETLNSGETNSCSVRDYARKVFDRHDIYGADHPLTKLIKSTLNYGAAAQGVTEPDAAPVAVMQAMYDYHLMAKAYWHD